MGEKTGIAWTDHTFNPWAGCTKVSPGCDHCYAEAETWRYKFVPWGHNAERRKISAAKWREVKKWNRESADHRRRVFCASWADVFDNQARDEWRVELWDLVRETPALDWLILTKRPQNIPKMLPPDWGDGYGNVWLGVTAENQVEFDRRWPILSRIQTAVRFVSYEPALGSLQLGDAMPDWLICGCESGPKRRAMPLEWARAIRDECAAKGVAFFMKQMAIGNIVTDDIGAFRADLRIREWPR